MIQAGAASRIAEMEAMKRNIAQAESEIKQSQQGYRAYQNRPVKTPADEALDTELNQRFQAYITGMQPMLKYAKMACLKRLSIMKVSRSDRWIMLIPIF